MYTFTELARPSLNYSQLRLIDANELSVKWQMRKGWTKAYIGESLENEIGQEGDFNPSI